MKGVQQMMKVRRTVVAAGMAAAVVMATAWPAAAHVTVQPDQAVTSSFTAFAVRVPNERDAAATTKVEVQLPEELVSVSFEPEPGWQRTVERKPRATPVQVFGEQVTDYIASVTWSGGRIEPGEFVEFGFSARTPDNPTTLRFPALQTYDGGEVVRWVGPADADAPAAQVRTFRLGEGATQPGQLEVLARVAGTDRADTGGGDDTADDAAPAAVSWAALALALVAVVLAVVRRRRT
jgi:uncharacterized protein YcnI